MHELIQMVESKVLVDCLPAGHSLTGSDSVAKVGTKAAMFKSLETEGDLIEDFGVDRLDEETLENAELFLVRIIVTKLFKTWS